MARSIKKGPFVDEHLTKKVEDANGGQQEEGHQDLVAAVHDPAGVRRPHLRGPQRPEVRPGVRDREHGRPQARRVRPDAHLPRPLGREEGRGGARRGSSEGRTWPRPRPRREGARASLQVPARRASRTGRKPAWGRASSASRRARCGSSRTWCAGKQGRRRARVLKFTPQAAAKPLAKLHQLGGGQRRAEGRPGRRGHALREDAHRRPGPEDAALHAARDGPGANRVNRRRRATSRGARDAQ